MFASKQTKAMELKDDEGVGIPVVIQKLSAFQLEEAANIHQARQVANAKRLGGELFGALMATGKDIPVGAAPKADRYDQHDRITVLKAGIKSWGGEKLPEEQLVDLDEETAGTLYRAIIDLSLPTQEQVEAAQSKG